MKKINIIGISLLLILTISGCGVTYLLHVGAGHSRLMFNSVSFEDAFNHADLSDEEKDRLRLITEVKSFGENDLGLKKTNNYETVYLDSQQPVSYIISAAPKDQLSRITWWFPIVGKVPYLGFFDLEKARRKKESLEIEDLDVIIGIADAYSTLGWFRDPVTRNLIQKSEIILIETILHEMTHTTLYIKGQGDFNEGLAVLVGKTGAYLFLKKKYGSFHPLTVLAQGVIEDERLFSSFLGSFLEELEDLYNSSAKYSEKVMQREQVFIRYIEKFNQIRNAMKTDYFTNFGRSKMNNAYLLSIGLYHQHFNLFEAILREQDFSIKNVLIFFRQLAEKKGDTLKQIKDWLDKQQANRITHR